MNDYLHLNLHEAYQKDLQRAAEHERMHKQSNGSRPLGEMVRDLAGRGLQPASRYLPAHGDVR